MILQFLSTLVYQDVHEHTDHFPLFSPFYLRPYRFLKCEFFPTWNWRKCRDMMKPSCQIQWQFAAVKRKKYLISRVMLCFTHNFLNANFLLWRWKTMLTRKGSRVLHCIYLFVKFIFVETILTFYQLFHIYTFYQLFLWSGVCQHKSSEYKKIWIFNTRVKYKHIFPGLSSLC